MKILLTGRRGQVGSELQSTLKPLGGLLALDRSTLDLADAGAVRKAVRETAPQLIVNAAAYTAVDRAESEPELAMRVNGEAPGVLAEEAKRLGASLVHYSTDYVFDGSKGAPYGEEDPTSPLGAYGRTKLAGEDNIRASGCRHLIVRTAWVYGCGRNFVRAILNQAATGAPLRVVDDQFGAPTWARDIADVSVQLLRNDAQGVVNVTAAGCTNWHEVAATILAARRLRAPLRAVTTAEYGARAPRPSYSVLDNRRLAALGITPIADWRARLARYLDELESAA